jgi:hypothetical protein
MYKIKEHFKNKKDWTQYSNTLFLKSLDDNSAFFVTVRIYKKQKECKIFIRVNAFYYLTIILKFQHEKNSTGN